MRHKYLKIILLVTGVLVFIVLAVVACLVIMKNKQQATYEQTANVNRYSKLEDVHFDDDKINIYLFWGNGCQHCEDLFLYLSEIWDDYSQYFNLYSFEIWQDKDNQEIMDYFMKQLGQPTGQQSTPTFIIGDELFQGFRESDKEKITGTIMSEYEDRTNVMDFSDVLNINTDDQ